jgi:hypothetical protein
MGVGRLTSTFWVDEHIAASPSPGPARLPVDALASRVAEPMKGEAPVTVTVRSDPKAPASVAVRQRTFFINACVQEAACSVDRKRAA